MPDSTRRLFLRTAALGAASLGAIAGATQLAGPAAATTADSPEDAPGALEGPLVALLRDASTGEFSVMVGEREVHFTDKSLAARLSHASSAQLTL